MSLGEDFWSQQSKADAEDRAGAKAKPNGQGGDTVAYDFEGPEEFKKLKRPKFVIPGLIGDNTTFLLFSPSGHYKSTLIALLFVLAANGRAMDGSEIEPVPVIIVANEDPLGLKLRLLAVATALGLSLANVRVLSSGDFKLDRPGCLDGLIASAKAKLPGWRPALVIDHYDVSMDGNPTDPEVGGQARDAVRYLLASGLVPLRRAPSTHAVDHARSGKAANQPVGQLRRPLRLDQARRRNGTAQDRPRQERREPATRSTCCCAR